MDDPVLALMKPYEEFFYARFPEFKIKSILFDSDMGGVSIHCIWEEYTIPRHCVLVYDIKDYRASFNPYESLPRDSGINWIHLYYIDKCIGLNYLEVVITESIKDRIKPEQSK